jgi:serine/threonine-protein kinase
MTPPQSAGWPDAGTVVGGYRLDRLLGEGATGRVYLASTDGGDQVALKLLRADLSANSTWAARFAHEARAAATVESRHLVPILESGQDGGWQYLAAVFVSGGSLADQLDGGPTSVGMAVRVGRHVAAGLDALHAAGLVHRDVKPSNILLATDGTALLTDFGLAKGPAYTALTMPGQLMGTVDYLAPELIRGGEASRASDLYALGCVMHECLAGSPPFAGAGVLGVARAHLEKAPPDLAELRSDLPPSLPGAVRMALEKDPARRPPTATAFATMLRIAAG